MQPRNASAAVIGAGDFIGAAIARKFAAEGFAVAAGRRNGEKLAPLVQQIEALGGRVLARSLDARNEADVTAFLREADALAPLEVCIFNVGANVNFSLLETTERVFRKVWEMACYAGFLAGREAARLMLPRGRGAIFFTGATASLRGGAGFSAFSSAKQALRALAQSLAREMGPKGVHVAHVAIDGMIDGAFIRGLVPDAAEKLARDEILKPDEIARNYVWLYRQQRSAWTHEMDLRPWAEKW